MRQQVPQLVRIVYRCKFVNLSSFFLFFLLAIAAAANNICIVIQTMFIGLCFIYFLLIRFLILFHSLFMISCGHNRILYTAVTVFMAVINGLDTKKFDKQTDTRYCIVIYSILLFNTQFHLSNTIILGMSKIKNGLLRKSF